MALKAPLLTVAIPTYNRAAYLDRCLSYLTGQLQIDDPQIEILVSDNCSDDNTTEVVELYLSKGFAIRYIRNEENKGGDFNIAQCYIEAAGQYVIALGDDDVFVKGSIKQVLEILLKKEYGLLHLPSMEINGGDQHAGKIEVKNYTDLRPFILAVNYYITFISGNIINTKYLNKEELRNGIGSFIVQVPFILNAIMQSKLNGILSGPVIATEPNNTGGYNLFRTFGPNLIKMILSLQHVNPSDLNMVRDIVGEKLLKTFFPVHILNFKKNGEKKFVKGNPVRELTSTFANYPAYWFFCFPLFYLPPKIGRLYFNMLKRIFF